LVRNDVVAASEKAIDEDGHLIKKQGDGLVLLCQYLKKFVAL